MGMIYSQGKSFRSSNDFGNSARIVLKEDIRKDWYFYKVSDHTVVKPYPVFDKNGVPCPCREDGVFDENTPAFLPQAMVIAPIATWSGLDGSLEFVDICKDGEKFTDEFGEIAPTPYNYLIRFLRNMTTESAKVTSTGRDGMAIHQTAQKYVTYFRYATPSIIFRGALIIDKGEYLTGKKVIPIESVKQPKDAAKKSGILLNAYCYVPQKSARTALYSRFNETYSQDDEGQDVTADNCYFKTIFEPSGSAIEFIRSAATESARKTAAFTVRATKKYQMDFAEAVTKGFMAGNKSEYFATLRRLFGQYQKVEDSLNIMTTQEMMTMLLAQYPAEWVWAAMVNTPFFDLIPDATKKAAERTAMRDSTLMMRLEDFEDSRGDADEEEVEEPPRKRRDISTYSGKSKLPDDEIPMSFDDDDTDKERERQRDIRAFVDEDETEDMKPAVDDSDDFGDDEEDSDDIIKKLAAKHGATANLSRG